MLPEAILVHARERGLPPRDAAQTFMQVVALKQISAPRARLMGGAALVFGYGSPRFSEDIDLAGVPDPSALAPGIARARREIEGWFGATAAVTAPRAGRRTWRVTVRLGRSESLTLHVDSQPFKARTSRPLVIRFQSVQPFLFEGLSIDEIMSEKVIAAACRRCMGGRDLFDLWFHWLREDSWQDRAAAVLGMLDAKLEERSLRRERIASLLSSRLSERPSLDRAREEWKRYLPPAFQRPSLEREIVDRCRLLLRVLP